MNEIIPGTVCCILCRGMVIYKDGDKTRFKNHLNNEHGAFFDIDYLLASCLLENDQKEAIARTVSNRGVNLLQESKLSDIYSETLREDTDCNPRDGTLRDFELKKEKFEYPGDTFSDESFLSQRNKDDVKRKQFECEKCGKSYTTKQSLKGHIEKHHPATEVKKEKFDEFDLGSGQIQQHISEVRDEMVSEEYVGGFAHPVNKYVQNDFNNEYLYETSSISTESADTTLPLSISGLSEPKSSVSHDESGTEATIYGDSLRTESDLKRNNYESLQMSSQDRSVVNGVKREFIEDEFNRKRKVQTAVSEVSDKVDNAVDSRFKCRAEGCDKTYTQACNRRTHERKAHDIESSRYSKRFKSNSTDTPNKTQEKDNLKWDELEKIRAQYYNTPQSPLNDSIKATVDSASSHSDSQSKRVDETHQEGPTFKRKEDTTSENSLPVIPGIDLDSSKYFTKNPKVVTSARGKSLSLFNEIPEGLPDEWKMRTFEVVTNSGSKSMIKHYLSPEFKVLKSALAVVEYLRLKGELEADQIRAIACNLNVSDKKLKSLYD